MDWLCEVVRRDGCRSVRLSLALRTGEQLPYREPPGWFVCFVWGGGVYEPWDLLIYFFLYIYRQIWHSVLHIQLHWHVLESFHATMPKDCCPRIVTQNRLILAFSVHATFKLEIGFSIFSRNDTFSLIYNFVQAVAIKKTQKNKQKL